MFPIIFLTIYATNPTLDHTTVANYTIIQELLFSRSLLHITNQMMCLDTSPRTTETVILADTDPVQFP